MERNWYFFNFVIQPYLTKRTLWCYRMVASQWTVQVLYIILQLTQDYILNIKNNIFTFQREGFPIQNANQFLFVIIYI